MQKRKWWLLTQNAKTIDEPNTTEQTADKLTELLKREYYEEIARHLDLPISLAISHEIGDNGTEHWHILIGYENQRHFNSIKKMCPKSHIDPLKGTPKETLDYLEKIGKHEEKNHTKIGDTYQYGDFPDSKQKSNNDSLDEIFRGFLEELYIRIADEKAKDIMMDYIMKNPKAMRYIYNFKTYIEYMD